MLNSNKSIGPL